MVILHLSHLGVNSMRDTTRRFYWPGMDLSIRDKTESCPVCIEHQQRLRCEPLLDDKIPLADLGPFNSLHADFGQLKGMKYLIVTDCYSGFVWVMEMGSHCTAKNTCMKLTDMFMEFGFL